MKIWSLKFIRRDKLGELDVDGETILRWMLEQYDVRLQERFVSHEKGPSCKNLKFLKKRTLQGSGGTVRTQIFEERENQQLATIRCLLSTSVSTCFGHHYAHLQENKDRVLLHTVYCAGSAGCGW